MAHEALIREWQRLHEWLMEDREGLLVHRHLTEAAGEWQGLGGDAGALYRGARLAQAREWAAANEERLNAAERAFLAASLEQEQHEALEREAQRRRELEAAQRLAAEQAQRAEEQARAAQKLRRRALMLGGALLLVVMLAGAALALGSQAAANASAAEGERQVALAREVAASALNNLSTDPERSILLALQAVRISTEDAKPLLVEAEDALHQAVETSRLRTTFRGHNSQLWSLALSKDGTRLATVGMDGTAMVWDLATNQVVTTLPTNVTFNLIGTGAAFTPDGKQLLTISDDNTATLWDAATGKALFPLRGHAGLVTSVAISPDGKLFATASNDKTVKLWDAASGAEITTLTGLEGFALQLAFAPDGKRVFAASDDTGIAIAWDAAGGKELFRFGGQGTTVGVYALAVSPDGIQLATGEFDATVKLWDAATGKLLLTLFGHGSQVVGVAYSSDGRYLASASEDGAIKLWDALTGRELLTLSGHTSGVMGVAFSPDGGHLYSASRDGTARIWDISAAAGRDWLNLVGHSGRIIGVAYRPDGAQVATWSHDGTVRLWDAATGAVQHTLSIEDVASGGAPGYSPDSKKVAVISGNRVVVFDAQSGAELFALPPFAGPAIQALFSHDGTRLVVGGREGVVRIFDSANGRQLSEFPITRKGSDGALWQMALSPDDRWLGTAQADGAFVWDVATGKQLVAFSGHGEGARTSGIAFSPDGKWAATTGNDGLVQVWDAATGAVVFKLTGHTGATFGVAFSPDGKSLASSSVDRTIKIWRLPPAGGQVPEPLTLHGHTGAVYSLAFNPDGTRLASVGRNPVARVYALNLADLVTIAQSQVTRSLTTEECRKYLHTDCVLPPPSCRAARSIQLLHIQHIPQRLPRQEPPQVIAEQLRDACVLPIAGARRVRADQHVGHVPQRAGRRQRLLLKHVECRPTHLPALQGSNQRRLVHRRTAADVDEENALLHQGEFLGADHLLAVRRVRDDHHDHVRLRQHRAQLARGVHPVDVRDGRRRVLDPNHPHAKGRAQPRRLGPNFPQPDDPGRLAPQVGRGKALPVMGTLARLQVREPAKVVENAHQAELGQRRRMHPARRRKNRVGHAHVIPHALDKLADARARRLHPAHVGRNLGQILPVCLVEVEEDVRLCQQLTPARLLLGAARQGRARVVGRIPRRPQQLGFVDDLQPRIHPADLLDIFLFKITRNQERIPAIAAGHKSAFLS